jgi:hypothetical protein
MSPVKLGFAAGRIIGLMSQKEQHFHLKKKKGSGLISEYRDCRYNLISRQRFVLTLTGASQPKDAHICHSEMAETHGKWYGDVTMKTGNISAKAEIIQVSKQSFDKAKNEKPIYTALGNQNECFLNIIRQ